MWGGWVAVGCVTVEFLEVGLSTLSKAAMSRGMNDFVFVVYSNTLATLFLIPCCFIFYRKTSPPPLTIFILSRIFLLGLTSYCVQMCLYIGVGYSSPTLAAAMSDLTPAFTFLLAIISRMEKLDLRAKSSRAKTIGTIISITGALTMTFYKGPPIMFANSSPSNLLNVELQLHSSLSNWFIGGFFLAVYGFLLALVYILLAWIVKDYPAGLIITLICSFFVSILSAFISLIAARDPNAWKLRPDIELIAIGYAGICAITSRKVIHAWALNKAGPVYVSSFKPLRMVIAIIMGVTFLGDIFRLGSVIGAGIIGIGFYSVVWGKANEEKIAEESGISSFESSSSHKVPLLQNKSMQV